MVKDNTLYDRLEISPNASDTDIKKAFNRLSKIWHPDKRTNEDEDKTIASQKFQEINEAKEVLLDTEKRLKYNQLGMDMFNLENQNQFANMNNPFAGFESMFGNNFQFNGNNNNQKKINKDIIKVLNVTLEQIYNEETINYNYSQKHYCINCNGEGTKNGLENICNICNGKGVHIQIIRMGPMIQQALSNCQNCNATGKLNDPNNICSSCKGVCYNIKSKNIQIPLKAGLAHNNKIHLSSKGNQYKNSKSDLILIINELSHNTFKRYENDLYTEIELKLYQALFGFNKIITHLDNRKIHINFSNNTNFNSIKKIDNEGMKSLQTNNKGNLYIKFIINIPNLALFDDNTKNQIMDLMQSIDKSEVNAEKVILTDTNLIKTILNDCNKDDSDNIINVFSNIKNNTYQYDNDNDNDDDADNNHNVNNNEVPGNCQQS